MPSAASQKSPRWDPCESQILNSLNSGETKFTLVGHRYGLEVKMLSNLKMYEQS